MLGFRTYSQMFVRLVLISHLTCLQSRLAAPVTSGASIQSLLAFNTDFGDRLRQLNTAFTPELRAHLCDTIATLSESDVNDLVPRLSLFDCCYSPTMLVRFFFRANQINMSKLFQTNIMRLSDKNNVIMLLQTSTVAKLRPVMEGFMDLHSSLPGEVPSFHPSDLLSFPPKDSIISPDDALSAFDSSLDPSVQVHFNNIFYFVQREVLKGSNAEQLMLVTSSGPVHPVEAALGSDAAPEGSVVYEMHFLSADAGVLRRCLMALQSLDPDRRPAEAVEVDKSDTWKTNELIDVVGVDVAYGAPMGWFGGDIIFKLLPTTVWKHSLASFMLARAHFELLLQPPTISWSNVRSLTRVLPQYRARRRIARQLMGRVGQGQQVEKTEGRSILDSKEGVEQGLIVHPTYLERFIQALRLVKVVFFCSFYKKKKIFLEALFFVLLLFQ
jgi:hypothetical protein